MLKIDCFDTLFQLNKIQGYCIAPRKNISDVELRSYNFYLELKILINYFKKIFYCIVFRIRIVECMLHIQTGQFKMKCL